MLDSFNEAIFSEICICISKCSFSCWDLLFKSLYSKVFSCTKDYLRDLTLSMSSNWFEDAEPASLLYMSLSRTFTSSGWYPPADSAITWLSSFPISPKLFAIGFSFLFKEYYSSSLKLSATVLELEFCEFSLDFLMELVPLLIPIIFETLLFLPSSSPVWYYLIIIGGLSCYWE